MSTEQPEPTADDYNLFARHELTESIADKLASMPRVDHNGSIIDDSIADNSTNTSDDTTEHDDGATAPRPPAPTPAQGASARGPVEEQPPEPGTPESIRWELAKIGLA